MVTRTQDVLWRTTLDEIRGLRSDVRELTSLLRDAVERANADLPVQADGPRAPLLNPQEVAGLLRTSRKVVYGMLERGQIPGVVRLGRKILVRREKLMRFISNAEVGR